MVFKLREIRKERKLTQSELSKLSGVHRVSIARYEEGRIKPTLETASKLAAALDVKVDELMEAS